MKNYVNNLENLEEMDASGIIKLNQTELWTHRELEYTKD